MLISGKTHRRHRGKVRTSFCKVDDNWSRGLRTGQNGCNLFILRPCSYFHCMKLLLMYETTGRNKQQLKS